MDGMDMMNMRNDSVSMNMNMNMNMKMYFHFSKTINHLLFESWNVQNDAEIFGAVVISFFLAVVYEGFKTFKDLLATWTEKRLEKSTSPPRVNSPMTITLVEDDSQTIVHYRLVKLWLMRAVLSVLRTVEIGMAYVLMLLAMTYNAWIFLSVCTGVGVGYFAFIHFHPSTHDYHDHCG